MLRILLAIFLLIPLPALAYHTETQTPYGITNSLNNDGSITVSWQESDGLEDNQPEYYIVYIGLTETADDVSVQTTFGFTEALSWQSHSFTAEYLYNNLSVDNQKIYAKVKAFHDTNGTTSDFTQVESVMYDYEYVPASTTTSSTTTSSTTTSSTTTSSTTTTTLPPPPPPPPTTIPPEEIIVDIKVEGVDKTYTQADVNDGTVDRDKERVANEKEYGCYMTDAQIERGDCDIPEEEPVEEVIIVVDEEPDTKEELSDDDDMVLEVELEDEVEELEPIKEEEPVKEEIKIDVKELEEEFDFEEIVIEIPDEVIIIIEDEIIEEDIVEEEIVEDELDKEIPGDDIIREDTVQEEDVKDQDIQEEIVKPVELTEEEVAVEVAEVEEVIEDIVIEEVTTEEVIEVIEQVNDIGVQNLDQATEEVQEVVQAVVEEAIENVEDLSEEQVAVVAEVLQVEKEDVEIIAEAVKEDEVVAEAVEEYVERAVENADVENYTLADVVTEVQYEAFLDNPIETFVDLDFEGITINNIGEDMTQDQKEKAQEVVVPVILTRIATMAAFVFRRSL